MDRSPVMIFRPKLGHFSTRPRVSAHLVRAGIALTLVALLIHAWRYAFMTDDAYISFRYAKNLSAGHGLVFNPGLERVEGYSNFLWVVLLTGFDRVGIPPERAANALSMFFTVATWSLIAGFLWRRAEAATRVAWSGMHEAAILLPLAVLALSRSFALWSTGGLETRLFEFLVTAGVLRLVGDLDDRGRAGSFAAFLFGLAALTRPDGMLVAASALAVAAALEKRRGKFRVRAFLLRAWPCAALIGAHIAFRFAYYHEFVPNTYFAKVGGRALWGSGLAYLAAFILEYGFWLWAPLLGAAVVRAGRRHAFALPALAFGVLIPHTLYIVAIGGDHFEYRPLDLWFPLLAPLLMDGLHLWNERRPHPVTSGAFASLLLLAGSWIPLASHRQFPEHYRPAFPGIYERDAEALSYLDPKRDWVLSIPPINLIASAHQKLTRRLTKEFVAVRQEEHKMFFERASEEAERLRALMARGVLPKDVRFAMSSVGVIPYVTGAATIDRLGLTDAHVAHGPFSTRLMAHGKHATMDYARARDVDLWFYDPVYAHLPLLSRRLLKGMIDSRHFQDDVWAAEVAPDTFLVCKLPQGVDAAARRMPRVLFRSFRDSSFAHLVLERSIEAQQEVVRWAPGEPEPLGKLALMLLENQRYPEAAGLYHSILQRFPDDPETLDPYAACQLALKDYSGAARTVGHQLEVLRRNGRTHDAVAVERNLRAIESIVPAVVTGGGAPSVAIGRSTSSLKGSRRR